MAECSILGCTGKRVGQGLCNKHYKRFRSSWGYYDPKPLRIEIERRRKLETSGLTGLARQMSARYGTNPKSEKRLLHRVVRESYRLTAATADRLGTFFEVPCDRLEESA